jgi:hypothetical protein
MTTLSALAIQAPPPDTRYVLQTVESFRSNFPNNVGVNIDKTFAPDFSTNDKIGARHMVSMRRLASIETRNAP